MGKTRVPIIGTVGKSIRIDDSLGPRVTALEEAIAAFRERAATRHSTLSGLQIGNDHPQYPLKQARETIKGQWDFTQQVWAKAGTESAPGYSFTDSVGTGMWDDFIAGDPQFSNVVLLVRAADAGAAGSSAYVDASSYARAVTPNGTIVNSATQSKFGGVSIKDDSSAAYLSFEDDFAPELQAITTARYWCQEGFVYMETGIGGGFFLKITFSTLFPAISQWITGNQFRWRGDDNVNAYNITSPASFPQGQWVHLALVRLDDQFIMYFNGVEVIRDVWSGDLANQTGGGRQWIIGGSGGIFYLDQLRWTMHATDPGAARYPANFTPPTAAFPTGGDQVSLAFSVDADEKFRMGSSGQFGIGGATYGNTGDYIRSSGATAAPTWATPQALTRANDANVTLTLTGAPTTALFGATLLTLGWQGTLATTRGGTGLNSYVLGDMLYANGLNSLAARAIGATNDVLAVVGGVPTWSQAIAPTWTALHTFNYNGGTQILMGTTVANSNPSGGSNPAHQLDIVNDVGAYQTARFSTYGAPGSLQGENNWHWQRARGTLAAPTATQNGDTFMSMGYRGHDGTGITSSKAAFAAVATENWTGAANGIKFTVQATVNGSTTRTNSCEFSGQGLGMVDGTIPLPGAYFLSDVNTGWHRPAADTIVGVAGGAEGFRLTPNGAVQFTGGFGGGFASAAGLELGVSGGAGLIQAFNRNTSAYIAARFDGLKFEVAVSGSLAVAINGVTTTGASTGTFSTANKPGSNAGVLAWLPVLTAGGTQGYIPIIG